MSPAQMGQLRFPCNPFPPQTSLDNNSIDDLGIIDSSLFSFIFCSFNVF